ncbi:MAG: hypothetical protein M3Q55_08885 [Acidobacteriota bacterium]|nr:hypothetical protein [Acidobacteriota bacterium]
MAVATGTALLIGAGISAAASTAASRSQQSSQRDASRVESSYTDEALKDAREAREFERAQEEEARTYERGRYADEQAYSRGKYKDERDFDRGQFANYLGRLDPYAKVGATAVQGLGASLPSVASQRPTMGSGMVTIQAPTGEVREVPEAQAAHYLSLGGKRVE